MPSSAPPAQHDHGTRRAGAIANGTIPSPPTTFSVNNLGWHIPDHLSAFSDLFPTPSPIALEVRSTRILPSLPRNHFHNQRYGPFSEDRDDQGKLVLPGEPPTREPVGQPTTHFELPARVRYPAKRITTAEIRKRVRNVLEYVGRVQVEEGKRKERAKILGIELLPLPANPMSETDGEAVSGDGEETGDLGEAVLEIADPRPEYPSAAQLMDELTRDLIDYQEKLARGGFAPACPPTKSKTPDLLPITPISALGRTSRPGTEADTGEPVAQGESVDKVEEDERGGGVERADQDGGLDVYREGRIDLVVAQQVERDAEAAPEAEPQVEDIAV